MGKVHEGVINAVKARKGFQEGSAAVIVTNNVVRMSYRGNEIFRDYGHGHKQFTLAGWNTQTTRRYLNAVGVDVTSIKGQAVAYGCPIDKNLWYDVYDDVK